MIVLDVEASGTEYSKHSIVSLGALDFDNPENRFYEECRIWDGAHIMDEALAVCGFTKSEVTDTNKQSEAELIQKFIAWSEGVEDTTFAGQNVSFDRDYVKAAMERAGENYTFAYRTIDTHSLAYMHIIKSGKKPPFDIKKRHSALNLDVVLNYTGIPNEPEPHNALTGALSHAEVVARILYDKQLLPEFKKYPIAWLSN